MRQKRNNITIWLLSTAVLVFLDWLTKKTAVSGLKGKPAFVIWQGVFELLYSENRGAAFGMFQGKQFFFFVVGIAVLAGAGYIMWRMPSNPRYFWLRLCTIMITAGALGNMIDRVMQGYVVDFFYFRLINFPIFNVADIYVTVATGLLLFMLTFYYKEEELSVFQWKQKEEQD